MFVLSAFQIAHFYFATFIGHWKISLQVFAAFCKHHSRVFA
jgi:hypothetical protein